MSEGRHPSERVRFGEFEADLRSGELLRRGEKVNLQEKPFQLLAALLERPGEVVLREEIQERLWGNTFVDFDNNLNASVKKLRTALGDSAAEPRWVETVPRRGYRWAGDVEWLAPESKPRVEAGGPSGRHPARWAALLAIAALLSTLWWLWPGGGGPRTNATSGKMMLAVLPFENLSEDRSQDYFSDGLSEELITHLGRLRPRRLGVIARLSAMGYKGSGQDADAIGRDLGVDYVLAGGVRRSGERVRITARLVQVSDGSHLWAESWDFSLERIFEVQKQVASRVARGLALQLLPEEEPTIARAGTTDTRAYEHYLKGRYHWRQFNREGLLESAANFKKAAALDPGYAAAWAGLADAYNLLAFYQPGGHREYLPLAEKAAGEALEQDPRSAEGHNALAYALLYGRWDFEGAKLHFERAVELRPAYAMAHHWRAGVLSALGKHDEAIASMRRSLAMEPKDLSVISDLGWYYLYADRYRQGEDICRRAVAESGYGWAKSCLKMAYAKLGKFRQALEMSLEGMPEDKRARFANASDPQDAWRRWHQSSLEEAQASGAPGSLWLAQKHSLAGNADEAFRWLESSFQQGEPWLVFLRVDPHYDALHDDPRFERLAQRIGLPAPPPPTAEGR